MDITMFSKLKLISQSCLIIGTFFCGATFASEVGVAGNAWFVHVKNNTSDTITLSSVKDYFCFDTMDFIAPHTFLSGEEVYMTTKIMNGACSSENIRYLSFDVIHDNSGVRNGIRVEYLKNISTCAAHVVSGDVASVACGPEDNDPDVMSEFTVNERSVDVNIH